MSGATESVTPPWLREFFGRDNSITWAEVEAGESPRAVSLRPWVQLASIGRAGRGLVLPALDASGRATWYACADNAQDMDALAEQINCFVGPSLVVYDRTQFWTPATACEQVLAAQFPHGVQSLELRPGASEHAAQSALALLAGLLLRRPVRTRAAVRPFAVVRAEFDQALATGDEALARRCIDELRASGRLNATNERFLHVRLMASLGRDAALVQDEPLLTELAEARLPIPIAVLRDVIEAMYAVHLQPLGDRAEAVHWVQVYRRELQPYERLLRHRRGLRSQAVLRTLLLQEVAFGEGKPASAEALAYRQELAHSGDAAWADRLLATLPAEASAEATAHTVASAPVMGLAEWAQQPPAAAAAAGLLQAALELGTLEAAAQALTALQRYPAELLQGLSPLQKAMRQMLEQLVPGSQAVQDAPAALADWTAWARWAASAPPSEEARCRAIAEQGAQEWDHASWLADASSLDEFKQLLQLHPARFKPYLALVHGSLQEIHDEPLAQAALLAQLATVVALDAPSPADLNLLGEWAGAAVRLGASWSLCEEIAGALRAAWTEVRSLRAFDWLCDVLEIMSAGPHSPDGELQALFQDLLSFAASQQHRLNAVQHRMLGLLALDFGLPYTPPAPPADTETTAPVSYAGVSIGIYTLQESIVPHLRQAVLDSFPGASVQFNHDHAATSALEHMARHSSVLVFAWRCSKHQAYYCIQKQRPASMPLLQPQGRGSASILRELSDYFGRA